MTDSAEKARPIVPPRHRSIQERVSESSVGDARYEQPLIHASGNDAAHQHRHRTDHTPANVLPIPFRRSCASDPLLQTIRERISVTTSLDFELHVDSLGSVTDIRINYGSRDGDIDREVGAELKRARFLPAKPNHVFVSGLMHMKCRIEAR